MTQETESNTKPAQSQSLQGKHLVFYDGVCGLCNKFVQFILERDKNDVFRFAALQSNFAAEILKPRGADPSDLNTVYILTNYGGDEKLLSRSDAGIFAFSNLHGSKSKMLATILSITPKSLRDFCYTIVVTNRYKILGKHDHCMMPDPATRLKFIQDDKD